MKQSVSRLAAKYGLDYLGFLTLTFADHITCPKEAQKRLNSLMTHVIRERYQDYICVLERQKSGRIHYHLVVALKYNIRKGVNFNELNKQRYTSVGSSLRTEWAFWRTAARKYRFGRTELLPIKSNDEAISKYVGKYISKHIEKRESRDKGVRLVRYSSGARNGTTNFSFLSPGSREWRRKVKVFAQSVSLGTGIEVNSLSDFTRALGPRWAWAYREAILSIP